MNWSHGLPQKNLLGVTYPIQFGTFESMMFRLSRFGGISFLEGTSPEYSHVNENSPNYKGKLIFHPPPLFGVQHLNLQAKYVTNGLLGPPLKLVFNLPQTSPFTRHPASPPTKARVPWDHERRSSWPVQRRSTVGSDPPGRAGGFYERWRGGFGRSYGALKKMVRLNGVGTTKTWRNGRVSEKKFR